VVPSSEKSKQPNSAIAAMLDLIKMMKKYWKS